MHIGDAGESLLADRLEDLLLADPLRADRLAELLPAEDQERGVDFTSAGTTLVRTDSQVMTSWRPMRSPNAATPSARATSSDSRIVASVEPSATVTIRSKAFIFASVRFPATLTSAISAA